MWDLVFWGLDLRVGAWKKANADFQTYLDFLFSGNPKVLTIIPKTMMNATKGKHTAKVVIIRPLS